jgi:hypothetical protein
MSYSLLRSGAFWTIVGMAVVGAGNAILPTIPSTDAALLEVLLGALASYLHLQVGQSTAGSN